MERGLSGLPPAVQALVSAIVRELREIPGVVAVALGGSYAGGTAKPDSDLDLGLYYHEAAPFEVDAVRRLANQINDTPAPTVTGFGGWGKWVNGGAWLTVHGQRVDFLYRNLDQLERVIADCQQGEWVSDYYQQFTHGFHSYIYLGELAICRPLHDPHGALAALKARVDVYPPVLRREIIREWLRGAEVWWPVLRKFAARGDVYNVAGSANRVAAALTQVLFALNETYFVTDKGALERIDRFPVKPGGYSAAVRAILAHPGGTPGELLATVQRLEEIHHQVTALCAKWT